ncbi:MAG: hypothetical protein MUE63_00790 [Xanthomonadales bacterium]|nr:hypothetical protein [Xanthomonadales bacterium]
MPRDIRPGRDPWPEISARIAAFEAPSARAARLSQWSLPQWSLMGAAASVALALALGWLLLSERAVAPDAPGGPNELAQTGVSHEAVSGLRASLTGSEAEYRAAFREFIPVGSARPNLSPQTLAVIETGWAELRQTETELTAALVMRPNDPFLNDRLLQLRARQLGFLQRLATLDLNDRRMTI